MVAEKRKYVDVLSMNDINVNNIYNKNIFFDL